MPLIESKKRQFMKESGLRVRSYEQGYSAAVTAISAADWAIEFPRPMPPNVQVTPAPTMLLCVEFNGFGVCPIVDSRLLTNV